MSLCDFKRTLTAQSVRIKPIHACLPECVKKLNWLNLEVADEGPGLTKPEEIISAAVEGKEEFRNKIIELQTKLIEAHETISTLNLEKVGLLKQVFELQKEVEASKRKTGDL